MTFVDQAKLSQLMAVLLMDRSGTLNLCGQQILSGNYLISFLGGAHSLWAFATISILPLDYFVPVDVVQVLCKNKKKLQEIHAKPINPPTAGIFFKSTSYAVYRGLKGNIPLSRMTFGSFLISSKGRLL